MEMRYFDLKETPKTGKTFLEEGANRLPATDERVAIYFQSVDLVKYDRYFDIDGFPKLIEYELQEDGTRYSHYKEVDGKMVPDTVAINKNKLNIARAELVLATKKHIQYVVDKYNKDHSVLFDNVHSCANYRFNDGYVHQQFCNDVWDYNEAVWEKARKTEEQVLKGEIPLPTKDEFIAMLPAYGGVV